VRADAERRPRRPGRSRTGWQKHLFELGTTPGPAKEIRVFGVPDKIKDLRQRAWRRRHEKLSRARWRTAWWQAGAHALFGAAYLVAIASVCISRRPLLLVPAAGGRWPSTCNTVQTTHFFRTIWLDVSRRMPGWRLRRRQRDRREPTAARPASNGIRLENVTFRYPGTARTCSTTSPSRCGRSTVAVVGENGAGKSTLVKLFVAGCTPPSAGRILVDGVDLAAIDPQRWRRRVSGSFQDFFPFEYTAAESIGVARSAAHRRSCRT